MTQEIMKAKTFRHNLKRKWRRSRTHLDRFRDIRQNGDKAKSKYLADLISENSDKSRRLWNSINNILHRIPRAGSDRIHISKITL